MRVYREKRRIPGKKFLYRVDEKFIYYATIVNIVIISFVFGKNQLILIQMTF